MFAWYWLIVAFVGGLVFATITWNAVEWDNVVSAVLAAIAIPFVYVGMFPASFFHRFVKPISMNSWDNLVLNNPTDKYWQIGRNTYLWHDPDAKKLFHKFFLVRIKWA